jgi:nucleoside-diphosphate-sugar epimerase
MGKLLITGGAGYIGSRLVQSLVSQGKDVICLDRLDFGGESLLTVMDQPNFKLIQGDLCEAGLIEKILAQEKPQAVIHLAAVVGDPACKREPERAQKTNLEASKRLLDASSAAGVQRFIFASTCSNYGKMDDPAALLNEQAPLAPISLYAETKVAVEKHILESMDRKPGFTPTILRFATVYGLSPRMRFDLTVNEFTRDLALGRSLDIFGEQFWRPYCHVADFSVAMEMILDCDPGTVAWQVFNVGDSDENYTKKMLIEAIQAETGSDKVSYVEKNDDPRDYRVDFSKISKLGFKVTKKVPDGIREISNAVKAGVFSNPDDARYANIPVSRKD